MAARAIVRDPEVIGGRWRLAGTLVPIADIRSQTAIGREQLKRRFELIQLTDEEIDAITTFEFPALRDPAVSVHATTMTIYCPCGEATDIPRDEVVKGDCICGRIWRVSATIEPWDNGEVDLNTWLLVMHGRGLAAS